MESQFIYCDCCESAKVETTEIITDKTFYLCNMCREYCEEKNIPVEENNFKMELVIDYSN
jgi:Pyruvate/2-oxoacid:ferredoxin oxidoreductase delta subunit